MPDVSDCLASSATKLIRWFCQGDDECWSVERISENLKGGERDAGGGAIATRPQCQAAF